MYVSRETWLEFMCAYRYIYNPPRPFFPHMCHPCLSLALEFLALPVSLFPKKKKKEKKEIRHCDQRVYSPVSLDHAMPVAGMM